MRVIGSVRPLTSETIKHPATPVEIYRIQNRQLTVQRLTIVVSVTEAPKVVLSVSPEHVTIRPGNRVPLKVVTHRRSGSRQNIALTVVGLPSGVRLQREVAILKRNQTEATLVLEPNIVGAGVTRRQNPFIGREFEPAHTISLSMLR